MASISIMVFVILGMLHLLDVNALFRPMDTDVRQADNSVSSKNKRSQRGNATTSFIDGSSQNVTVILGQVAILYCRVRNLGNRTVSWLKKKEVSFPMEISILTSMTQTYTSDERFTVLNHLRSQEDWHLRINNTRMRDEGVYECQVNTDPKIHKAVHLKVLDIKARILGPDEIFVKKGSTINVTCTADSRSDIPNNLIWYHAGAMIDFDSPRGGMSLEIEKSKHKITSNLLITKASFRDGGTYTCVSIQTSPASVVIHVLNGENPAAIQRNSAIQRFSKAAIVVSIMRVIFELSMR